MMCIPTIVLLIQFLASLVSQHVTAQPPTQPTFVAEYCKDYTEGDNSDYVDPFGGYASNLKPILVGLQEQAVKASYYNTSAGTGADKVYVQYYCRGDIDTPLCSQCIREASLEIMNSFNCSRAKTAVVWYLECTLRYDNQSAVGVFDRFDSPPYTTEGGNNDNVPDAVKFDTVRRNTMNRLINEAAYRKGSLGFATGEGVISPSVTLYYLVQCSPDLNGTQCEMCLTSHIIFYSLNSTISYSVKSRMLTQTSMGPWMYLFLPSCQLRYSTQIPFYSPPASPLSPEQQPSPGKKTSYSILRAAIPAAVVGSLILLGISFCIIQRRTAKKLPTEATEDGAVEPTEFLQFDLKTIVAATNHFSVANKLGQGGFGIVYQGRLKDGQDIAVKRLSHNSGQGIREFKTEVAVVAKLQHKNLVHLVGCCVDGKERLLVYEFLRNLSLDRFLFDKPRSAYLTWEIRHKIIQGIARGLHYLHEDSRLKIVHRDLKTSNILLDDNLDPKIADFGLARLVKVDQTSGNTSKVVGTYGYMAPEYAIAGRYSTKSDVYSFGAIVLEILSGKTNNRFYEISHGEGLLSHAWRVWNEGTIEQLMDQILQNNFLKIEAERCLQIGLLCVQDDEANRPTMHAVLVMLNSNTIDLPPPFSPSHYNYINKLSESDETGERTSKLAEKESYKSSADTLSAHMNPCAVLVESHKVG